MPQLDPDTRLKTCARCQFPKLAGEFYNLKAALDGLDSWCKECRSSYDKTRHSKPKIQAAKLAANRRYKAKNAERTKESRAKANKAYMRSKPGLSSTYWHNYQARLKVNGGSHTHEEWEAVKAIQSYTCLDCKQSEPAIILTRDHILPVSRGGSNDIKNIRAICGPCNSRKGAKLI